METNYLVKQSNERLDCFTQENVDNYTRLDFIKCKKAIEQTNAYIKGAEQLLQTTDIDLIIETSYPLINLTCDKYTHKFKERDSFRNGYNAATNINKTKMYTFAEMQKLLEICMKSATIGTSVYIEQQANDYISSLNRNTEMDNITGSNYATEAYKILLNDAIELLESRDHYIARWIQEQMIEIQEVIEQLDEQSIFNDNDK
jgi:hypothetical protein